MRTAFLLIVLAGARAVADPSELRLLPDDEGPRPPLDAMTDSQLGRERVRLLDTRPGLAAPVVLLSIGAPLLIAAGILSGAGGFVAATARHDAAGSFVAVLGGMVAALGAAPALAGLAMVIVGCVVLRARLNVRAAIALQLAAIDARQAALDHERVLSEPLFSF